ncbi:hypothetical protein CLCR_06274 [Cladophialophora carrionii]|uniref:Uncharacterized protein n=1 Tax=Cladophialophora carrionii TaxID=86049 RepID=A0A1C1C8E9_9EURO|nr:hypothetical protein CLCR_06274 [Cladophialophora carrionii]
MDFSYASIACSDFPMLNQNFAFSDGTDDVRPCGNASLYWCSQFPSSYPNPFNVPAEQHPLPTPQYGHNACEDPWFPSWTNGYHCTQPPQTYSKPTLDSVVDNMFAQPATASCPHPPVEASRMSISSYCTSSSHDGPSRTWRSSEASDYTSLASGESAVVSAKARLQYGSCKLTVTAARHISATEPEPYCKDTSPVTASKAPDEEDPSQRPRELPSLRRELRKAVPAARAYA